MKSAFQRESLLFLGVQTDLLINSTILLIVLYYYSCIGETAFKIRESEPAHVFMWPGLRDSCGYGFALPSEQAAVQ